MRCGTGHLQLRGSRRADGRAAAPARAARGDRAGRPGRARRLRGRRAPPPDFAVSAPAVVLAAAAARTSRIRLTSAVTVLSSDDPVRVFEEFATLDLLSGGRAEIMAGRGSFIESFPLFGFDLDDYDELFAEKLELLLALRDHERVTWSGLHRAPLHDAGRVPAPAAGSAADLGRGRRQPALGGARGGARAGACSGDHRRNAGAVRAARRAPPPRSAQRARRGTRMPVGINSHAFVAERSQDAARAVYPGYAERMDALGRERGWPPVSPEQFETARRLRRGARRRQHVGGGREDPLPARDLRPRPVSRSDHGGQRRTREGDALHRAPGNGGRAGGPGRGREAAQLERARRLKAFFARAGGRRLLPPRLRLECLRRAEGVVPSIGGGY